MGNWYKKTLFLILGLSALFFLVTYSINFFENKREEARKTMTLEFGSVSITSTVSGKITANKMANLSFPTIGLIKDILIDEGDYVESGEIIASLTQDVVIAQYNSALHNLSYLKYVKEELLNGPQEVERKVSETSVMKARQNLDRTKSEYDQIVKNTYEAFLSSDLEAVPVNKDDDAVPPIISGNYQCTDKGIYNIYLYKSSSPTDYSYKVSGLEEDLVTAWTETASPLGDCGLYVQFDSESTYRNGEWFIEIPNSRSANYLTNLNKYKLVLEQQKKAISEAENELALAQSMEKSDNLIPSSEVQRQADEKIAEAESVLSGYEAQINNLIIKAPFSGIVTNIDMRVGETSGDDKRISIINDGGFELIIRLPEANIRNVNVGDKAEVKFDASPDEIISGEIKFISPLSINIEGVSYYEAHLTLLPQPDWLREGLNADVKVYINKRDSVLTLPKYYTITKDNQMYVLVKNGKSHTETLVKPGLIGNDGFIEVTNLEPGTVLVLP